ncbi:MAG: gamma-glutamylcyclotransferase family protein [Actinomycetota bacterium]
MFYFAYGSNMDPEQMEERTPGARALGAARLGGYRLTFTRDSPAWGGGVGHIEADANDEVWGVLWDLTEDHLGSLDVYEGIDVGAYVRETLTVSFDGRDVEAHVYLAIPRGYKQPSKKYMSALIRGAEAHGCPDDYIERLRSQASGV